MKSLETGFINGAYTPFQTAEGVKERGQKRSKKNNDATDKVPPSKSKCKKSAKKDKGQVICVEPHGMFILTISLKHSSSNLCHTHVLHFL